MTSACEKSTCSKPAATENGCAPYMNRKHTCTPGAAMTGDAEPPPAALQLPCRACPGHPSLPDRKFVRMQHLMRRHPLLLHSGRPDEPCLCPGCPHAHAGPALHSPPRCSSSLGRLRPAVANSSAPAEAAGSTAPKDILLLFNWPPACKPDAFAPVTRRLGTSPVCWCV